LGKSFLEIIFLVNVDRPQNREWEVPPQRRQADRALAFFQGVLNAQLETILQDCLDNPGSLKSGYVFQDGIETRPKDVPCLAPVGNHLVGSAAIHDNFKPDAAVVEM
jgi:hypothetical protein